MPQRARRGTFIREVDMYPPLLRLLCQAGLAVAEVPFFGKRIDLLFCTPFLVTLSAVETKLRDWRDAFKQAALNQLGAQRSYVALPWDLAARLADKEEDLFRRYDVGLIGVGEVARVLIPPRKNGCSSLRHHRALRETVKKVRSSKPKTIGVVADAIAKRSKALVVLQVGTD
jgi:hypothetical protein